MSLRCSEKEKFFKFFSSDVQIRIMTEKEIYCYINGFLKWNISKKTSYVIGHKKFFGKIGILNLRNKRKSTVQRYYQILLLSCQKSINQNGYNHILTSTQEKEQRRKKCAQRRKSVVQINEQCYIWRSNRKLNPKAAGRVNLKTLVVFLKNVSSKDS